MIVKGTLGSKHQNENFHLQYYDLRRPDTLRKHLSVRRPVSLNYMHSTHKVSKILIIFTGA